MEVNEMTQVYDFDLVLSQIVEYSFYLNFQDLVIEYFCCGVMFSSDYLTFM